MPVSVRCFDFFILVLYSYFTEMPILFKYRTPINFSALANCNTARIFSGSALYYAQPSTFNDPFDGRVSFDLTATKDEALDHHLRVLRKRHRDRGHLVTDTQTITQAREHVREIYPLVHAGSFDVQRYYRDAMDHFGALALSSEKSNLLLWAHYADQHKGLCLGFDWEESGLPVAQEVAYSTRYQKVNFWAQTDAELSKLALFQKSADWSYEKEYRSVNEPTYTYARKLLRNAGAREKIRSAKLRGDDEFMRRKIILECSPEFKELKVGGFGPQLFKKESLKEVIFGERMSLEDARKHVEFIVNAGYSPIFRKAVRSGEKYGVDFKEIDLAKLLGT